MRTNAPIIFLLWLWLLAVLTPEYCAQIVPEESMTTQVLQYVRPITTAIPCYTVVSHPDDPVASDYTTTHTVTSSGIAYGTTSTTTT